MSGTSLERGLNALREQIDAPTAAFFSSCVHCGMCAEACLFYTETGDPKYTPINKVEPMRRIWEREYTLVGKAKSLLGLSKPVDEQTFKDWETLVEWPEWFEKGRPSPTGRYTFTTARHYQKENPLMPSGLLGPVTIRAAQGMRVSR